MKTRFIMTALMSAAFVLLASCSQDDGLVSTDGAADGLVPVTLSVTADNSVITRANDNSDDHAPTRCFVQVCDGQGNPFTSGDFASAKKMDGKGNGTFSLDGVYLHPTTDYVFLFWADNAPEGAADVPTDLTKVTYVKDRIAFAKRSEVWRYDGTNAAISETLNHVVAKVTLKTTSSLAVNSTVTVTVPTTYTTYNVSNMGTQQSPLGGESKNTQFALQVPSPGITGSAEGTKVFSFYALVAESTPTLNISYSDPSSFITTNDGDVPSVPLGPNKHTTLVGDVLYIGLQTVTFKASVDEDWTDGGTVHFSPYTIDDDGNYTVYNAEGLQAWNTAAQSNKNISCTLGSDISMEEETWVAITDYAGTFDGAGHTISGLKDVNNPNGYGYNKGFIGTLNGGTVRNLVITDASVSGTRTLGGIVGGMENGTVSGCSFSGTVTGSQQEVGGIVGRMENGTVSGCTFSGTVSTAAQSVGGIVGYAIGTVSGCCSYSATINGGWSVGGIVGDSQSAQVISCWSTAEVSASAYVGGISGITSSSTFTACYWSSNVAQGVGSGSDTTTKVDGNTVTWLTAMAGMNASLSGTNYRWVVNDGTDAATRPLIINRYQ